MFMHLKSNSLDLQIATNIKKTNIYQVLSEFEIVELTRTLKNHLIKCHRIVRVQFTQRLKYNIYQMSSCPTVVIIIALVPSDQLVVVSERG
jgi:hypothetical protein